ncbi:early nodule-specific protein 2-like [Arachis stenosperma]|uniref:early nodule-specific protein 2-like n=1 Tax=Arachis stenosperma TaxID=217475 RepID=UPI0025AC755F|nr:early nodule-specific protein 2-like [Arachis stenosperma]
MCPKYILVLLLALTFAVANSVARVPTLDNYPPKQDKRHHPGHPPLEEEENTQVNNYHGHIHKKHPPLKEEENTEVNSFHGKPIYEKPIPKHPPPNNPATDSYHPYKPPHKGHPPKQGDNSQEDTYLNKPPHGRHGDHPHHEAQSQEDNYPEHRPRHPPHPPTPVN